MKAPFMPSLALALTLASATSFAMASELQPTSARTQALADRLLSQAGVDATVSVRASIDPDGQVTGVTVLRSSGSPQTDRTVEAVLKRVIRADPPLGLSDGAVTLNLAGPAVQAARVRPRPPSPSWGGRQAHLRPCASAVQSGPLPLPVGEVFMRIMTATLFTNAALFDGLADELRPGAEVLVADGLIQDVSDRAVAPPGGLRGRRPRPAAP